MKRYRVSGARYVLERWTVIVAAPNRMDARAIAREAALTLTPEGAAFVEFQTTTEGIVRVDVGKAVQP